MLRLALTSLALVACKSSHPTSPPPAARNFVCERISVKNPQAKCDAEYTDVGEHHAHTARVTIGADTVSCGINDAQLAVVCDGLFVQVKQQAPAPEATKK